MSDDKTQPFRLSPQQRRLWFQGGQEAVFSAQLAVMVEGPLNAGRLRRGLAGLVEEHEILRTSFRRQAWIKVPSQAVSPRGAARWRDAESPEPGHDGLRRWFERELERPFDLEEGAPLEIALASLDLGRHLMLLRLPALCADARTLINLLDELVRSYAGEDGGEPLQYADFSEWQNELLATDDASALDGKAFWERQKLPASRPDAGSPFRLSFVEVGLPSQRDLADLAARLETPLPTVMLGLWLLAAAPFQDRRDPVVGAVFDGRKFEDLQSALGLFARSLPLRVAFEPAWSLKDALTEVRRVEAEAREWEEYGVWDPEQAAFPMAFEFVHLPGGREVGGATFRPLLHYSCSELFLLKLCVYGGDEVRAEIQYDSGRLARREAAAWAERVGALVRQALSGSAASLARFEAVGETERHQIVVEAGDTTVELPASATLHEIFEEQAKRTPEAPAVVCEGWGLSFAELNRRANRLGHYLRQRGVSPESRVAIFLDRSLEMIVAILGVLKAGGAFVPLDPAFPRDRVAGMLEDAKARVIVTREALEQGLPAGGARIVRLDAEADAIARCEAANPSPAAVAGNLVYVLFTSGSTGRPKGVAIQHRSLVNYVRGVSGRLGLPPGSAYATVSTFAADLGNTAVFPALCTGGCLHVITQERASDPVALAQYLRSHPIDCLKIVPSHLEALLAAEEQDGLLPRRWLVLGGEATRRELAGRLRALAGEDRLLNHYGPTEATVGSTTYRPGESRFEGEVSALPLGRPLPNQRAYVVDAALRLVPVGAPGELLLGGTGVARGYLDQPAATGERFLPDAWSGDPGARVYRTGDRVRLLPDGTLEFLGRLDHQVKVRGFRIETGEIEATLAEHPAVRQTVVVAREDRPGDRRLVAYLVPRQAAALQATELRGFLKDRLPGYMIPSAFVTLQALPLTANGKIDRMALPEPDRAHADPVAQVAPRSEVEEILARIWEQVLGVPKIGIHDNFFELGGDSILVIQVIARAVRHGLRFTPKQFFESQTVAELASVAGSASTVKVGEEGPRPAGPMPLTPIQAWFLEQGFPRPEHWNQAVFLRLRERIEVGPFRQALSLVQRQHDAFRLRFRRAPEGWLQSLAGDDAAPLAEIDLGGLPSGARTQALEAAAADLHRGLDLESGPLLLAALFDRGAGEEGRLLLVAHHLVVDGVSWRILLEDLLDTYRDLTADRPAALPSETTDFAEWARRLVEHAWSGALLAQAEYWRQAVAAAEPLPLDHPGGRNDVASELSVLVELEPDETTALLQQAPTAYRTQINDLLLTALAQAFETWTGSPRLLVELEGHGREDLFLDVDLSRTVGWFTTHFPVLLDLSEAFEPGEAIRAVKEQLRRIPEHGIGYGLLRHVVHAPGLDGALPPQVCFNYLGQLDQVLAGDSPFAPAPESSGAARDPRGARRCSIEVVGRVLEGRLRLSLRYSGELYERSTIERLGQAYGDALRTLIDHCRSREQGGFTPSDFPLADLDQTQLEKIASRVGQARLKG